MTRQMWWTRTLLLFFVLHFSHGGDYMSKIKVCVGSLTLKYGGHDDPIPWLRYKYENCTHVNNHLIIRNVHHQNISFLSSIVEVYGSVLIIGNNAKVIPLNNLRVIRGEKTYSEKDSSLYIFNNKPGASGVVDLTALRSITKGNVVIRDNEHLCYKNTIKWNAILENPKKQSYFIEQKDKAICKESLPCHPSCNSTCWAPGRHMCQQVTNCVGSARCYHMSKGERPCNDVCIGGCWGPTKSDCFACRNYDDNGICVDRCDNRKMIHKPQKDIFEKNKDFRYTFKFFCVKSCPVHFYALKDTCLSECNDGYYVKGNECKKCVNGVCPPGICSLEKLIKGMPAAAFQRYTVRPISLGRSLLKSLSNCTFLWGGLRLNSLSTARQSLFGPDEYVREEDLLHLRNLRHVRGGIHFDLKELTVTSLYFLENLQSVRTYLGDFDVINGKYLTSLGLRRWTDVRVNDINLYNNPRLCYLENFREHFNPPFQGFLKQRNIPSESSCKVNYSMSCDHECNRRGCWGPGPDMCVECRNYRANRTCVKSCELIEGFYAQPNMTECTRCHEECLTCDGPGPHQCLGGCRHFKDDDTCVKKCPYFKYPDKNSVCRNCSNNCEMKAGCTGPFSYPGKGGCNLCIVVEVPRDFSSKSQLRCSNQKSELGYYHLSTNDVWNQYPNVSSYTKINTLFLSPCHENCVDCFGRDSNTCRKCQSWFYIYENSCLRNCSSIENTFPVNTTGDQLRCQKCHRECSECDGPSHYDCLKCKNTKVPEDPQINKKGFFCNSECPDDMPYKVFDEEMDENVCSYTSSSETTKKVAIVACSVISVIICIVIFIALMMNFRKRQTRAKFERESLRAKYTRKVIDDVKLETTDQKPDSSHLRVIGCNQIKKKHLIGAGAFGTVYEGIWTPQIEPVTQRVVKIPVAIKELKDQGSKNSTEEFLSEARLMASVDHEHCMKLLGVCLTSELMLISEFMPLGNLRNYLIQNQSSLGSQRMLRWALQIAKGMSYLNAQGIVHRDLAARNVLLESEDLLRITDFGLAKLVGSNLAFQDRGQRLPIRWLAIECIKSQIFSTKSDVWAYGVTLWEIFSYGQSPYPELLATEILPHLQCGERLPQPQICTLDMYMVLIKCWLADSESRPTFDELIIELKKMAADPGRFLIIENDALWKGPTRSASVITCSTNVTSSPQIMNTEFTPFGATADVAVVNLEISSKNKKSLEPQGDRVELSHYVTDPTLYSGSQSYRGDGAMLHRLPSVHERGESIQDEYEIPNELRRQQAHSPGGLSSLHRMKQNGIDSHGNGYVNTNISQYPNTSSVSVDNPEYGYPSKNINKMMVNYEDYPTPAADFAPLL